MRAFWLLAALLAAPDTAAQGCAALGSADAKAGVKQGQALPGLGALRAAIVAAAQAAGRGDVSCGDVGRGEKGESLQCYSGNHVAIIGQAPKVEEGVPLVLASFGDGIERRIDAQGVWVNGRKWNHLEGSALVSAVRAQQLFCESVVSGNPKTLVMPINDTREPGEGPKAIPAIHYAPKDESPRQFRT